MDGLDGYGFGWKWMDKKNPLTYYNPLNPFRISFFKTTYLKQLIYAKPLIRISFFKTTYSKQLIYAKQLIRISFFKTTYLCKIAYYDLFFKKNSLFKTAYLYKNNLSRSLFKKQLNKRFCINKLFYINKLFWISCFLNRELNKLFLHK